MQRGSLPLPIGDCYLLYSVAVLNKQLEEGASPALLCSASYFKSFIASSVYFLSASPASWADCFMSCAAWVRPSCSV